MDIKKAYKDILQAVQDEKPVEVQNIFNDVVKDRIISKVEDMKPEITAELEDN